MGAGWGEEEVVPYGRGCGAVEAEEELLCGFVVFELWEFDEGVGVQSGVKLSGNAMRPLCLLANDARDLTELPLLDPRKYHIQIPSGYLPYPQAIRICSLRNVPDCRDYMYVLTA